MCAMNSSSPALIRFGVFELDPRTGELRKQGMRLKLSHQASKLLRSLLEVPGRIRTREELRQQLWGNKTFVDFDNSLNKAVYALREALGDSATNPRFIETVAGQGYRFILLSQQPSRPAPKSRTFRKIESVAVLPFVSQSAEPEIEFMGSQITARVITALSKMSGVRVLAYSTVQHYQPQQRGPRLVGEDLGVDGVVSGELVRHNTDLCLNVELIDVADGTQVWGAQLRQNCQQIIVCSEQFAKEISRHLRHILAPTSPRRVARFSEGHPLSA
jgi:TolB-like protein